MELPKLPVTNVVVDGLWEEQYGPYTADQMQEYARQAVLMEREACANICNSWAVFGVHAADACAKEILERT